MSLKFDEYGVVKNDPEAYESLAKALREAGPIILGWTDGEHTHLSVLLCLYPMTVGRLTMGLQRDDLYVAIMGIGAFGFAIKDRGEEGIHHNYVAEKLFQGRAHVTAEKLTELINGLMKELLK